MLYHTKRLPRDAHHKKEGWSVYIKCCSGATGLNCEIPPGRPEDELFALMARFTDFVQSRYPDATDIFGFNAVELTKDDEWAVFAVSGEVYKDKKKPGAKMPWTAGANEKPARQSKPLPDPVLDLVPEPLPGRIGVYKGLVLSDMRRYGKGYDGKFFLSLPADLLGNSRTMFAAYSLAARRAKRSDPPVIVAAGVAEYINEWPTGRRFPVRDAWIARTGFDEEQVADDIDVSLVMRKCSPFSILIKSL
jgi:hypothetical protein